MVENKINCSPKPHGNHTEGRSKISRANPRPKLLQRRDAIWVAATTGKERQRRAPQQPGVGPRPSLRDQEKVSPSEPSSGPSGSVIVRDLDICCQVILTMDYMAHTRIRRHCHFLYRWCRPGVPSSACFRERAHWRIRKPFEALCFHETLGLVS